MTPERAIVVLARFIEESTYTPYAHPHGDRYPSYIDGTALCYVLELSLAELNQALDMARALQRKTANDMGVSE